MTENTCWICGAEANSSEHRLKKSDLVRAYGRGPYSGSHAPLHVRGAQTTRIQGPNSRAIKYTNIICHTCNTTTSQPYDQAYEALIAWLFENEDGVLHRRFINFEDVFGSEFASGQRNLYKYLAKSFGCRLAEANQTVPEDIRCLLGQEQFQTALRITFSVNEDILKMPIADRCGFIGKDGLVAMVQRTNPKQINGFRCNEHVSWFTTHYWYDLFPDGSLGATWVADSQFIYLGSHEPLPPDMRADFMEMLTQREINSAT